MTWHYEISDDGTECRIWDETADPSADTPTHTQTLDQSDRQPDRRVILDAMFDEAAAAYDSGDPRRALVIVGFMAGEQIKKVNT